MYESIMVETHAVDHCVVNVVESNVQLEKAVLLQPRSSCVHALLASTTGGASMNAGMRGRCSDYMYTFMYRCHSMFCSLPSSTVVCLGLLGFALPQRASQSRHAGGAGHGMASQSALETLFIYQKIAKIA